jgi:RNA polymerase sigma-70 factor, ECF subfamily
MTADAFRSLIGPFVASSSPDARESRAARPTDEQLLAQAAAGDRHAFEEIVFRYRPRLTQFVRWNVTDAHLVEDITQEVFLRAFQSAASFRGESAFRTWLYALARNTCRHHYRQRDRCAEDADGDETLRHVPDAAVDPLSRLQQAEVAGAVRDAVERLPSGQRLALLLRDWEDLSYAQIGEVLGIPVGTVRSRIHNARARVAEVLREKGLHQR